MCCGGPEHNTEVLLLLLLVVEVVVVKRNGNVVLLRTILYCIEVSNLMLFNQSTGTVISGRRITSKTSNT